MVPGIVSACADCSQALHGQNPDPHPDPVPNLISFTFPWPWWAISRLCLTPVPLIRSYPDPHQQADIPAWPQPVPVPREVPSAQCWGCSLTCSVPGWGGGTGPVCQALPWPPRGTPQTHSLPVPREPLAPAAPCCTALDKNCSWIPDGQENSLKHMNHSWE